MALATHLILHPLKKAFFSTWLLLFYNWGVLALISYIANYMVFHQIASYSTAQRQFDLENCATAWKFSGEDYFMHSILILNGAHYIHACIRQIVRHVRLQTLHTFLNKFLMKLNIKCIYMMTLWRLSLYVPIDSWINCPTEKLLPCSCLQYLIPHCLMYYRLVWRMDPLLAIVSPLTFSHLACQLVGSQ